MGLIEELLDRASGRHPAGDWHGRARHALTICACVTLDASPDWIIFDTEDGIGWLRRRVDMPEGEIVRAALEAGGHADPSEVVAWLQGTAADPWTGGDGYGDAEVVIALRRWIDAS
ncbi:hypothetical protein BJ980_002342 [Nocardioides daedukensis]|uniref:Uncharacterized protein n=1 Tax=Nocardioides daedukensis TaxID=634462 RepID=A0A7Y9S1T1_9ACTN|nr:hypothetical protein [Nocardioides daedukensis]NYG59419.1 hypothetical protein [Nocardioides daedukensis]